ncbi:5-bromo-4-chloroindolyl phosphate hydrolysis family protein [Clostridium saccharoperbutylacetonicum]|uniref:5-bromo-4-chloroindolyl phosphate hydrolysis family protein n=1 Tax=Clostridium saccharoperbutylacetonicum TaxID=36745 RepID=UPI0039E79E2D
MGKKDFSDLEDQIMDTVKSAFDAIDFAKIKKEIDDKTEGTINEIKVKFKDKSDHINDKIKVKMKDKYRNINTMNNYIVAKNKNELQRYIARKPVGRISGMLYTIFGSIGSGLFGTLSIIGLIYIVIMGNYSTTYSTFLTVFICFFLVSLFFYLKGRTLRDRVKRFKKYVTCLEEKKYCSTEELAVSIARKNKFVIKDLKKMVELNMFPEGRFDEKQTYFMLNYEVYENYLNAEKAFKKRQEDDLKKQEQMEREKSDPEKKELLQVIEIGQNYIEQINNVNNAIQEEEISGKLDKLQNVVTQILKYIEKNPNKLSEVNKFINHYLPMTLKLVNSYKELNEQPVQGMNIKNAKSEIEKAIDSINMAFEKLLDDLFEELALDISTDISVLETLFTQEGLTKKDFEK